MANENALTAVQSFALAPISREVTDLIKEELDGLGQIPFDTVKIPAGGSVTFELFGDDPDNPEVVQTLTGVIVHHHAVNSYWPGEFDGSNNVPDCSSADGKQGLDIKTGEVRDCSTCPFNQFGSSSKGNGKACKNGHRIYLLRSGEMLPILISLQAQQQRTHLHQAQEGKERRRHCVQQLRVHQGGRPDPCTDRTGKAHGGLDQECGLHGTCGGGGRTAHRHTDRR